LEEEMHRVFTVRSGVYLAAAALSASLTLGCVEQSADTPSEEDIKAAKENILSAPPATIQHPVNAQLDDKLVYLGLDVDADVVTPGKAFTLTHYWKVLKPVPDEWKLFVHLESPDSKKSHLNADHVPIGGKYPLHVWKKDEIIRDIHRVSVPAAWPGNAVEIYVGAWKGPLRMKVTSGPKDGENRIFAVKIPTTQPKEIEKKKMVAKKVKNGSIKIDGKLDEAAWKDAPSTGEFVRTMDGMKSDQKTTARVLYDDKNLYVAFEMEDKDVWATLTKADDKLWTQEAVEMFIDADGDGKTYVELQTNPKGAIFDSYLPAYRQNQNDWQSGMKVGVKVDGTVDNRNDVDKGWVAEMMIPLEAAKGKEKEMKNVPPKVGTEWRVNFFRLDMPAGRPQQGTAWAPPLVGDFHALDKFGVLVFGDDKGNAPNVKPASEEKKEAAAPAAPANPPPASKAPQKRTALTSPAMKAAEEN
jgi:hypothetical protein